MLIFNIQTVAINLYLHGYIVTESFIHLCCQHYDCSCNTSNSLANFIFISKLGRNFYVREWSTSSQIYLCTEAYL